MRSRVAVVLAMVTVVTISTLGAVTAGNAAVARPVAAAPGGALRITVLSSRPEVVSGGNALLRVEGRGVPPDRITVQLDGSDVTASFRSYGHGLEGLLTGLRPGANTVTARASGADTARVQLADHPITGPVLAGPHEQPFVCDTREFTTVTGAKLGDPIDADCSVRTRVDYVYRRTTGSFAPLPAGNGRPDDLAWTTTATGAKVPYIVRVETGTIDRAIYETAVLHDPRTAEPTPWQRSKGWNRRLVYTFGGGCPGGWYVQGRSTGGVLDPAMLGRGYAVASSSLNVFGNNCNDLLAAEAMSMVKERFVEAYGRPAFTIGWGCSGGSYQTHQIADNYPGLLDGMIAGCSFPDVGFGTVHTITDARLLDHYFTATAPDRFTREQQRAVSGFGKWESIGNLAKGGGRIDPRIFCPGQLPVEQRYDPVKNPTGARCDVYDHTVNAFGRDPATGFARRPLDNHGIQYGLKALQEKKIDLEQFIDLNTGIGGYDQDANFVPGRTAADPGAVDAAYRSGRMLNAGLGLKSIPIIDHRGYTDDAANGDIHMRFQSFATRARLEKANGTHDNQVMLVDDNTRGGFSTKNPVLADALGRLDRWITSGDRPDDLTDACWTRGSDPEKIEEPQVEGIGNTRCNTLYPVWTSPRMVAGGPTANDIVTCRLRPIRLGDYPDPPNEDQLRRLREAFPRGVCDWSRPGIGQVAPDGVWQSF